MGHGAKFGFILRTERNYSLSVPALARISSFLSLLCLQFGELTGEDKGRSRGSVRIWMQSARRGIMGVWAPVVTVEVGRGV